MKQWQCTVCGYIHEGPEPPDECPVCGADKSEFIELLAETETPEPAAEAPQPDAPPQPTPSPPPPEAAPPAGWYERITAQMVTLHAHPISTHIPNGVLPVAVFFLFLAIVFQLADVGRAAFYNMVIVLLSMPFVLFSGYNDWQRRFGGRMTNIFRIKIICGATVVLTTLVSVIWWVSVGDITRGGYGHRWLFFLFNLITLGAAVTAGYMGGKLVFNKQQKP
jgi:rubredoxin